jgi:Zn-dependent M28 family amino/carboxypeptidase
MKILHDENLATDIKVLSTPYSELHTADRTDFPTEFSQATPCLLLMVCFPKATADATASADQKNAIHDFLAVHKHYAVCRRNRAADPAAGPGDASSGKKVQPFSQRMELRDYPFGRPRMEYSSCHLTHINDDECF